MWNPHISCMEPDISCVEPGHLFCGIRTSLVWTRTSLVWNTDISCVDPDISCVEPDISCVIDRHTGGRSNLRLSIYIYASMTKQTHGYSSCAILRPCINGKNTQRPSWLQSKIRRLRTQVESRERRRHCDGKAHRQMQTSMAATSGSTTWAKEPATTCRAIGINQRPKLGNRIGSSS